MTNGLVSMYKKSSAGYSGMWVHTSTGLAALPTYSPPTTNNDPILPSIDHFTIQALFG